jgi:hypothetical protein
MPKVNKLLVSSTYGRERATVRSRSRMWELYDEYVATVENSRLAESSKNDYIVFANFFMRWIDGEFNPGGSIRD